MIASLRWLEALLGRRLDARETADVITMRCAPVDAVVPVHQDLGDVLVGRVLEVKPHPNADRLTVCVVDAGSAGDRLEVVCGATNVAAGKTYPFAPVGAVLPGGLKLERKKIRGVESNGMLCSAKELGLGDDHAGILELETDAKPGTRFTAAVPVADHQIVIDVGANRPDLLGHKGIARELGAALGAVVKLEKVGRLERGKGRTRPSNVPTFQRSGRGVVDGVEVRLEDPEGAPRYMIAVIRGVRVGPSPRWLADRLGAAGQRSINNVVDATNYVLFELNQPLHAFDLAKLRGPAVVVRRAKAGEKIGTLDGVERTLNPDMTVICDAERPTIIAGVMGSAESEVTAATTDVVLECAYFQPTRIRRTRKAVGLQSESSYRFERGIDMQGMPDAMRRAIDVIRAVAGGEVPAAPLDLWPEPLKPTSVFLQPERVERFLGVPMELTEIERHLSSVGFVVAPKGKRLAVQVPGWRPDVTRDVDLIEEIARLKGYDTFPDQMGPYRPTTVPDAPEEQVQAHVRAALAAAGLLEARTIPLGAPDGPDAVAVTNPLSAQETHLRSRILPALIKRVEFNWTRRTRDIRLFEVGTVFRTTLKDTARNVQRATPSAAVEGVGEELHVAGVITGARGPLHWAEGAKVPDMDLWDLKYHFELAVAAATPSCNVQPATGRVGWVAVQRSGGAEMGWAGPLRADAPAWAAPLYGFEVTVEVGARAFVPYQPLPIMPPVERDLALVLGGGVTRAAVDAVLRRETGELLERLAVFDEYRGPGVPEGARGVAWHLAFRHPTRTLREEEVDRLLEAALKALEAELGVRRRAG